MKFLPNKYFFVILISLFIISLYSNQALSYSNSYNISIELKFNKTGFDINVDQETAFAKYNLSDISDFYSCANTSTNFVIGLVSMGNQFNYVEIEELATQYRMQMQQQIGGNSFIIPITQSTCGVVETTMQKSYTYIPRAFTSLVEDIAYPIVISLKYSGIDIKTKNDIIAMRNQKNRPYCQHRQTVCFSIVTAYVRDWWYHCIKL